MSVVKTLLTATATAGNAGGTAENDYEVMPRAESLTGELRLIDALYLTRN